jgi:hypothetical protein
MIHTKLYLVKGIKYYTAWQGDSGEETVKLLVPAGNEEEAKKTAFDMGKIDELINVRLLYEVVEGCGWGKNGVWEVVDGFDGDIIYSI